MIEKTIEQVKSLLIGDEIVLNRAEPFEVKLLRIHDMAYNSFVIRWNGNCINLSVSNKPSEAEYQAVACTFLACSYIKD